MQLEDLNSYEIIRPAFLIQSSKSLAKYIDCPPDNNSTFSGELSLRKQFCPRLFDAFNESKKPLKNRSLDERLHLKQKLLEDVESNVAAADAQFEGEKRLGTDILPSDPDACIERLGCMEEELHTQIRSLQLKLKHVGFAQDALESIKKNKLELDAIDKTPFMSLPQELAGKNKKARRE
jgi:hypothetical protein